MKNAVWRGRFAMLGLACCSILTMGGCGLSDQQLSSIWSQVLTAGLSTIIQSGLGGITGTG